MIIRNIKISNFRSYRGLTNIDFTIAVVAEGTVYKVVISVDVKSTFLFTKTLAMLILKRKQLRHYPLFSPLEK